MLLAAALFTGCGGKETILRTSGGDIAFSISVDKAAEGQPLVHYISVVQADNTPIGGKTLLTSQLRDVSQYFDIIDRGNIILITANNGPRTTLWLVWDRNFQRFENPQDFGRLSALARENNLSYRDTNVFAN